MKKAKVKLIVIKWKDATLEGTSTLSKEQIEKVALMPVISGGIFLRETREEIVLAPDTFPSEGTARCVNSYPKALIEKVKIIEVEL
jgi:hypothetical protein